MSTEPIKKRVYFPHVKIARELLRERTAAMIDLQHKMIIEAAEKGEFEAALKANQWLIEHGPGDEDGTRIIDSSAAKPKEVEGPKGPSIAIGISLGGMSQPKQLTAPIDNSVIDVTPLEDTNEAEDS